MHHFSLCIVGSGLPGLLLLVGAGCVGEVAPPEVEGRSDELSLSYWALPEDDLGLGFVAECADENACPVQGGGIFGCDDRTPPPEGVDAARTFPWSAAGHLEIGAGGCTGALVGERWVLTAAHCFDDWEDAPVRFRLARETECLEPFGAVPARRVLVPDEYAPGAIDPISKSLDVALVELVAPVPGARRELELEYVSWNTLRALEVESVGYPKDLRGPESWTWRTGRKTVLPTPAGVRWIDSGASGTFFVRMDGFGGQSGAPVFVEIGGRRLQVGVLVGAPVEVCQDERHLYVARITRGLLRHVERVTGGQADPWWSERSAPGGFPTPPVGGLECNSLMP